MTVSKHIADWLYSKKIITQDELECYEYGITIILGTIIPLVMATFIGRVMGLAWNSLLLMLPFLFIRKFSGGFHMRHAWSCIVLSIGIIIFCLLLSKYCKVNILLHCGMILSVMSLILLSPLPSSSRFLSVDETKLCKRIVVGFAVLFCCLYFILIIMKDYAYAVCVAEGIMLTAILQQMVFIQRGLLKHGNRDIDNVPKVHVFCPFMQEPLKKNIK